MNGDIKMHSLVNLYVLEILEDFASNSNSNVVGLIDVNLLNIGPHRIGYLISEISI